MWLNLRETSGVSIGNVKPSSKRSGSMISSFVSYQSDNPGKLTTCSPKQLSRMARAGRAYKGLAPFTSSELNHRLGSFGQKFKHFSTSSRTFKVFKAFLIYHQPISRIHDVAMIRLLDSLQWVSSHLVPSVVTRSTPSRQSADKGIEDRKKVRVVPRKQRHQSLHLRIAKSSQCRGPRRIQTEL